MSESENTLSGEERNLKALIALSMVEGVGPGKIRALKAYFGTLERATKAPLSSLTKVLGIGQHTAKAIIDSGQTELIEAQFQKAEKVNATLLTSWNKSFPENLNQIYDPPVFLWQRGTVLEQDKRAIAIVGTRKATDYGKNLAYDFAQQLAQRGFTIVSGLAYGIDTQAHKGALDAGGRTFGILGSGVDVIYPSKNISLANRIMEQGALLSEYPMGASPDAPNFPRRNRIISGLSLATVVIEAFSQGGALITAKLAFEQNREVFALPGNVYSKASGGTHKLIQMGIAKLATSPEDILSEIGQMIETDEKEDFSSQGELFNLNTIEQKLYDNLSADPIHIDQLCLKTGIDPSSALVYLLNLEFSGLVRQMAGKQFVRI